MKIQHNMQAMNVSRMLDMATNTMSKMVEKLSSGYAINRAADDASGLSISEKMRQQIRGLDRASINAQDGISAVQTAEGALAEVHSMLHRMNELAVQAANGTNSESDREAVQEEIGQLITEINRVAETTKFNEIYLLNGNGKETAVYIQAKDAGFKGKMQGAGTGEATFIMNKLNSGERIFIGNKNYTIGTTLAVIKDMIAGTASSVAVGNMVTVNGTQYQIVGTDAMDKTDNKYTKEELANSIKQGDTVVVGNTFYVALEDKDKDGISDSTESVITNYKAYDLIQEELRKASSIGADPGSEASVRMLDEDTSAATVSFVIKEALNKNSIPGLQISLHVGVDAEGSNKISFNLDCLNSSGLGISNLNIVDSTGDKATSAIDVIDDAIAKVSAQRSDLGAIQNRLEHTITNLNNVVENTTAAESEIRDADMADMMVEYSKNNILQQAGQSMLAQANSGTEGVLALLQ